MSNHIERTYRFNDAIRIYLVSTVVIAVLTLGACTSPQGPQETAPTPQASTYDTSADPPSPTRDVFAAATGSKKRTGPKGSENNPVKRGQTLTLQYTSRGFSQDAIYVEDGGSINIVNRVSGSGDAPTVRFCRDKKGPSVCNPGTTSAWRPVTYRKSYRLTVNRESQRAGEVIIRARPYSGTGPTRRLTVHVPGQEHKVPSGPRGSENNPVKRGQTLTLQYTSRGFSQDAIYVEDGGRINIVNRVSGSGDAPTVKFCPDKKGASVCNPGKPSGWIPVTYRKSYRLTVNRESQRANEVIIRARPYKGTGPTRRLTVHVPSESRTPLSSVLVSPNVSPTTVPPLEPTPIVVVIKESITVDAPDPPTETAEPLVIDTIVETIGVSDDSSTIESGGPLVLDTIVEIIGVSDDSSTIETPNK